MKKVIFTSICLITALFGYIGGLYLSGHQVVPTLFNYTVKSVRKIPETADFGAYLAGILARNNQDVDKAASYYEQAYLGDSLNSDLIRETYLLNGLAGRFDVFMQTAVALAKQKQSYYAPLFLSAEALKQGEYEKALSISPLFNSPDYAQGVLYAVIRAWSHAGLGRDIRAFQALLPLKGKEETKGIYWYQRALIGMYLKQPQMVKESFEHLTSLEMPTVTTLMAARWFYLSEGEWNEQNKLFQKYQQTLEQNQALGEMLVTRADEFRGISPARGVAEAFFFISTIWDMQGVSAETGLIFNQLAVFLDPQANIYKIWGAEQFEAIEYYAEANRLYNLISPTSHTILFKKALNLMFMEQMDEAEKILIDLSSHLPNQVTIISVLGNLYRDTNRPELAEQKYNQALGLIDMTNLKEVAHLYFMRAVVQHKTGKKDARDESLLRALSVTPEDAEILNYLGYVWLDENKNLEKAITYIKQAHQLSPHEPHIWDSLAWGYYKKGYYQRALTFAEQAADKMPYSALIQSHLGDIYSALGREREAGFQYNKALNLDEDMTDKLRDELTQKLSVR